MSQATFTRKVAARKIAHVTGQTIAHVNRILELNEKLVEMELGLGNRVKVGRYGVLTVRNASAKLARNPRTNEEILVPARRKVVFREFGVAKKELNAG